MAYTWGKCCSTCHTSFAAWRLRSSSKPLPNTRVQEFISVDLVGTQPCGHHSEYRKGGTSPRSALKNFLGKKLGPLYLTSFSAVPSSQLIDKPFICVGLPASWSFHNLRLCTATQIRSIRSRAMFSWGRSNGSPQCITSLMMRDVSTKPAVCFLFLTNSVCLI